MEYATPKRAHIIACSVFEPALEYLLNDQNFSGLLMCYLPSHLHLHPNLLKESVRKAIQSLEPKDIPVVFIYGRCFPEMDAFCRKHGIKRIRGEHCYEIMLGSKPFQDIMEETAGTYFLEQNLVQNFEKYCIKPLELDDEEMRRLCLSHYRRIIYLQQPNDPDLSREVEAVSSFLNLPATTLRISYTHLKKRLMEVLADNTKTPDEYL